MPDVATAADAVPPLSEAELAERLVRSVRYCRDGSAYYRDRLDELGVVPEDIDSLSALAQLPVLLDKASEAASQQRSRDALGHPFGEHLCAPLEDVVGVAATSGTTGDPTYYAFTQQDIELTDRQWASAFTMGGVRPGDTVLHAFGLSMFLAGVPVVRALERMGARPVPVGAEAGSDRLIRVGRHMQPVAICCTPSYAEFLIDKGVARDFGVRHIFCAGEPGAGLPEVRERISEGFGGATVTDVLGGVHGIINVSCEAHAGMHMLGHRHCIQQLMDPDTGQPVSLVDGVGYGVRVKTTLDWRAQPQLRSSVGDVYEVMTGPCACGRTEPRARVIGRVDDLLIVKGVKLYPAAVQNIVFEFRPRLTGHFRIVLDEPGPKVAPPMRMRVEVEGSTDVVDELRAAMHARLAVTPDIEAVRAGSLPRESHKTALIEIAGRS
jgi:phenylacetate-CoA ligase